MGLTEITLILVVALILFGPEDLPVIARTLGKIVAQVRSYTSEITKEFKDVLDTPTNVVNGALKTTPSEKQKNGETVEGPEELLTYDEPAQEATPAKEADGLEPSNPLAELPTELVIYPKEKQAGE